MPKAKRAAPQQRKKKPDPRVAEILSAIDVRRQQLGVRTLEELTRLARGLPPDKTPDNASTWHGWRDGSTNPKLVDLDDFARVVGLNVGLIGEGVASTGAPNMSATTRQIATLVEGLSDQGKQDVLEYVERYRKMWGTNQNPQAAADEG